MRSELDSRVRKNSNQTFLVAVILANRVEPVTDLADHNIALPVSRLETVKEKADREA